VLGFQLPVVVVALGSEGAWVRLRPPLTPRPSNPRHCAHPGLGWVAELD